MRIDNHERPKDNPSLVRYSYLPVANRETTDGEHSSPPADNQNAPGKYKPATYEPHYAKTLASATKPRQIVSYDYTPHIKLSAQNATHRLPDIASSLVHRNQYQGASRNVPII